LKNGNDFDMNSQFPNTGDQLITKISPPAYRKGRISWKKEAKGIWVVRTLGNFNVFGPALAGFEASDWNLSSEMSA
jgi:hypothetical protein